MTMQIHERHIQGWPNLKYYSATYFAKANGFQNCNTPIWIVCLEMYVTQVLQYVALEFAITALRAAKPYNMGSIYW